MTTQITPFFKEEPGFNSFKLGKKQITPNLDIKFEQIKKTPKTLQGYGITDAVKKEWIDEKLKEMQDKINELENRITTLENKS